MSITPLVMMMLSILGQGQQVASYFHSHNLRHCKSPFTRFLRKHSSFIHPSALAHRVNDLAHSRTIHWLTAAASSSISFRMNTTATSNTNLSVNTMNPMQSSDHVSTPSDTVTLSTIPSNKVIPRAAVSIVARYELPSSFRTNVTETQTESIHPKTLEPCTMKELHSQHRVFYLLVQRGKEPNKGMWSFPGGKIETGEFTFDAAQRELWEETGLGSFVLNPSHCNSSKDSSRSPNGEEKQGTPWKLDWYDEGPIACTDSIIYQDHSTSLVNFHYVITQWFVQVSLDETWTRTFPPLPDTLDRFPPLIASDDAAKAQWFDREEIFDRISTGQVTKGVDKVIQRVEFMFQKGLLGKT